MEQARTNGNVQLWTSHMMMMMMMTPLIGPFSKAVKIVSFYYCNFYATANNKQCSGGISVSCVCLLTPALGEMVSLCLVEGFQLNLP